MFFSITGETFRKYTDGIWRMEGEKRKGIDLSEGDFKGVIEVKTQDDRDGVDRYRKKLWPTVIFKSSEGVFHKYTDGKWKREEPDLGIHFQRNRGQFSLVEPSEDIQRQIDELELVESQSTEVTAATIATAATVMAAPAPSWKKRANKEKQKGSW
jgi:hypothetical protein